MPTQQFNDAVAARRTAEPRQAFEHWQVRFAGAELFWRFSTSGLSTMLAVLLVVMLVDALSRLEPQSREGTTRSVGRLALISLVVGILTGLLALLAVLLGAGFGVMLIRRRRRQPTHGQQLSLQGR